MSPRARTRDRQRRCYELAFVALMDAPEWVLVHGTVSSHAERISHAWLEYCERIYDPVMDRFYSAEEYAREWSPAAAKRYTMEDVAAIVATGENAYGPWESAQARV